MDLTTQGPHTRGITQYSSFGDGLTALSTTAKVHPGCGTCQKAPSSIRLKSSAARMGHTLCIHSSVHRHWGCCHFLAIVNKVVNISAQHPSVPQPSIILVGNTDQGGSSVSKTFAKWPRCLPQQIRLFFSFLKHSHDYDVLFWKNRQIRNSQLHK